MRQEDSSYLEIGSPSDIPSEMDPLRRFIKDTIEERKKQGMTLKSGRPISLKGISEEMGQDHAYMQQFLNRGTPKELSESNRHTLAEILGLDQEQLRPGANFKATPGPRVPQNGFKVPGAKGPTGGPVSDRTLPVFGRPGEYGVSIISTDDSPVDWTFSGPLEGVPEAYATFIYGDSMDPAYADGDLALIHPHLPPKPGRDVHIILHNDEAFVRRLVRRTGDAVIVRQFNPAKETEIPAGDIRAIRSVVGRWDR